LVAVINAFLAELRRRNVFRVAAAYLVVGWVLIQLVTLIEAPLALPSWTDTMVIVLLGIGFPVALLLAWAFEITPEGMQLTTRLDEGESAIPHSARKLDYAIAIGLVLVILMLGWQQVRPQATIPTLPSVQLQALDPGSASVAVLPFADMSAEGDQEYFADGISEEILNVLVRLPGLRVAGRTSSFAYKGRDEDLREIGEALGVSHVLEGSVRRSGARLRITAQLIRSDDGFHIWSETYDREMTDIFDIQDEIAESVTGELAASLGLTVERADSTRTDDIQAYEDYLRARPLYLARENMDQALALLTTVVARDPDFSPGWSTLAGVYLVYMYYQDNASPELEALWRQASLQAANRAIALNPLDAEAYAYRGEAEAANWDRIRGFESLDRALELAPSDASVLDRVAQNMVQVGYFDQAERLARRAVDLDPQVAVYHFTLSRAMGGLGDNDRGSAAGAEAIRLSPTFLYGHLYAIARRVNAGDLEGAQAGVSYMLASVPASAIPDDPWHDFIAARTEEDLLAVAENSAPEFILWRLRRWSLSLAGETESMLAQWNASLEATEPQEYRLFLTAAIPGARNDPRWKAQIRRSGILALWESRGFPTQCRPLGGDDFECDEWTGSE
jgi:TolB-like protein/tetratricopeptide (TPR) repeat protein